MHTLTVIRYDRHRVPRTGALLDVQGPCDPFAVAMARLPGAFGGWPDRAPSGAAQAPKALQGPAIDAGSPPSDASAPSAARRGRREPTEE